MAFRLSIEDGSYVQTLEVRSGSLTVGRAPPKGLALSSPGLSARHAVFQQAAGGVQMTALPTKVGVRLRGERIDHALLVVGDTVMLGWAKVTVVEMTAGETVEPTAPPVAETIPTFAPAAPAVSLQLADEPAAPRATPQSFPDAAAWPQAFERTATLAGPPKPAPHHPPHEPDADFVVLSRKAIRVLPWWGISVALHAAVFGAVLIFTMNVAVRDADDGPSFAVTLRRAPERVEIENVPPIEPSRRGVDVKRPDMDVVPEAPDSTMTVSADPKGGGGTAPPRLDDPGLVMDDPGGGSPWAQPGGSTSIGVGAAGRVGSGVGSNLDEAFGKGDAERANAAAAGKLNGDPFTRSLVNGLKLRTNEKNVRVVKGDYDQAELVMEALGLRHGWIDGREMSHEGVGPEVRAIFFNCTGRPAPREALTNLARWVEDGGWLFTSDWAVDLVLDKGFPGYVKPMHAGVRMVMTPDETITFTIAPGKHLLLAGLPPEAETSRWWLEDSSIPFTIEKPEAVEVLAQSADLERKHGSKFVAVTFPYGKGRVVHVLGHMFQKEGNLRGAYAMQRLLINFLYQAIRGEGTGSTDGNRPTVAHAPPKLTLPEDVVAEATSQAGRVVSFPLPATDYMNRPIPAVSAPSSGSTFPLGTTTVKCAATDTDGFTSTGSFTVTIRDTTPPVLSLPGPVTAEATSPSGCAVALAASAIDLVSGKVPVICVPPSGAVFPLGTTTVRCTARDAAGNSASGSFDVTVRDTTPPDFTALSVEPNSLAPADRRMVHVVPKFSATDAVTTNPTLVLVSAVASDADAAGDVDVRENGDVYLRAERSAAAARTYTLTFKVKDAAGNLSAPRAITVTVP